MGIGVSLAFIAIGAILAFALEIDLSGVNIDLVGWILMLVGLVSMGFTLRYARRANSMAAVDPTFVEAAEAGPDTIVREERIVERPVDPDHEPVERVIERTVPPRPSHGDSKPQPTKDPANTHDPAWAQDPAQQNLTTPRRRGYFRR